MKQATLKAAYALSRTISKHRNDSRYICCPEDCWCWDADSLLTALEAEPLIGTTLDIYPERGSKTVTSEVWYPKRPEGKG